MGIKPNFTKAEVSNYLAVELKKIEDKIIEACEFAGEGFVKAAREMTKEEGGFGDITGNLRSSIGYFIVKDGKIIKQDLELSEKGSDRVTGLNTAKQFIKEIMDSNGIHVYGVAGMEYASEVESRGFNVISAQEGGFVAELKILLNGIK